MVLSRALSSNKLSLSAMVLTTKILAHAFWLFRNNHENGRSVIEVMSGRSSFARKHSRMEDAWYPSDRSDAFPALGYDLAQLFILFTLVAEESTYYETV
jgi:hypothetical protein